MEQISQVGRSYERLFNKSLESAIKSEFSGNSENALVYLLCDPIEIYCRKLQSATVGQLGTDESLVCRIIGGNEKHVVREIAARYFKKYDRSLIKDLEKELSGLFSLAVITYIDSHDSSFDILPASLKDVPSNAPPPAPVKEVVVIKESAPPPRAFSPQKQQAPVYMESKPTYSEVATLTTNTMQLSEPKSTPEKQSGYPVSPQGIPEVMRGWAVKEGHFFRNWKRRYFVLISTKTATILRYYEEESDTPPYGQTEKGEINIRNYSVSLIDGDTVYIKGKNEDDKDMKLKIDESHAHERTKWMEAFRAHIDYRSNEDSVQRAKQLGQM